MQSYNVPHKNKVPDEVTSLSTFSQRILISLCNVWWRWRQRTTIPLSSTTYWNLGIWADTGRTQEQPQNHRWNASRKFIFVTSRTWGSLKQCHGRDTQAETPKRECRHCASWSTLDDRRTCWFLPVYIRDSCRCGLALCFGLYHSQAGSSSMLDRLPLNVSQACAI